MNIQEAIKSTQPFRRKGWSNDGIFVVVEDPQSDLVAVMETDKFQSVDFSIQDILADDWYTRDYKLIVW